MKKTILLIGLILISTLSFPDSKITRGPNVGEIYFIGPTHTGLGLYYSTDFGQTAICVDSTFTTSIMSICADKTEGVVYYVTMGEGLYISYDYGNMNTWNLTSGGVKIFLNSGRNEGEIYSSYSKKSTDYGQNFYWNSCNGWFGNTIDSEIDNLENHGYACVYSIYDPDTLFLQHSNDDFENLNIQYKFINNIFNDAEMTRGINNGEVYFSLNQFNYSMNWLLHSVDFGQSFDTINGLNLTNYYQYDIVGGRQEGELFFLYNYVNMMWQNAHTYIFYSIDYGQTFDVYHPFGKGNEPLLANFSTIQKEIYLSTPIEFCNYSIGEILEYQWDFENDGIIDSYEKNPVFTFSDTGWYTVKLSVVGLDSTNSFVKENYIHVIDTTTDVNEKHLSDVKFSPNPVNNHLTIRFNRNDAFYKVSIFSLQGEKIKEYTISNSEESIIDFSNLISGIYLINMKNEDKSLNFKIIKN
ncbi:MAG: T9SS type A sorting domain-containing protein [Erysipelotrichia bacterium]|nr:T9SS type A sorting domain-containing protein [Erysipelotrichia bacterium]